MVKMRTHTFLWNGKQIRLISLNSTAPSSSTSSPSSEEPEQKVEKEVMIAPKVKIEDIKDGRASLWQR